MADGGHNCLDHLAHRDHEWYEAHGLDCGPFEYCFEEWFECAVCGQQFSEDEALRTEED